MLSSDEIARNTLASWALFKGDAQGMRRFDVSFEGFWRSFSVILLLLPAMGIMMASERIVILDQTALSADTFPAGPFALSRIAGFVIGWFDYPLVLALLAGPLGLGRRYVPLIVALNWTSLLQAVPIALPALLHVLGLIGDELYGVLSLVALGVVLRYQYVVTRAATDGPVGFCIGLVALDYVLSIGLGLVLSNAAGV